MYAHLQIEQEHVLAGTAGAGSIVLHLLQGIFKDDVKVYADEEHFKFVMRNLLSNAVKYTHHNGTIEIDAQRDTGEIIFSVKDNGIGMTDEEKAQVFQPFIMSHEGTANEKEMVWG